MRTGTVLLFIVSLAIGTQAQTSTTAQDSPDVLIQNYVWGATQRMVYNKDPKFEANSGGTPLDTKGNPINTAGNPVNLAGVPINTEPVRPQGAARAAGSPLGGSTETIQNIEVRHETYVEVKNSGNKTIKAIRWDYVFFADPALAHELKRYKFRSKKKLAPGAIGFLSESVATRAASHYQRVFINHVEFADGTAWQRP